MHAIGVQHAACRQSGWYGWVVNRFPRFEGWELGNVCRSDVRVAEFFGVGGHGFGFRTECRCPTRHLLDKACTDWLASRFVAVKARKEKWRAPDMFFERCVDCRSCEKEGDGETCINRLCSTVAGVFATVNQTDVCYL